MISPIARRQFLTGAAATAAATFFTARAAGAADRRRGPYGPLATVPDANGWLLPDGFTSRVLATTATVVPGTSYTWHVSPDGGATFPQPDGGWVYTSNSESPVAGGAGALRFDAGGNVVGAYRILSNTQGNCAGGPTPWGTWLSCEEYDTFPGPAGRVWECQVGGAGQGVVRPAMGRFNHEAAACDPDHRVVYLTEDKPDAAFYRFVPNVWGDLSRGTLQGLVENGGVLSWVDVPDPSALLKTTRSQLPARVRFNGSEGVWYADGVVYVSSKGDNTVRAYDADANTLTTIYDDNTSSNPIGTGLDNITMSMAGDLYVVEDGGDMQVFMLTPAGGVHPVAQLQTSGSELTGVAFAPSGRRMYVSSQRNPGRTYEISGPFRRRQRA